MKDPAFRKPAWLLCVPLLMSVQAVQAHDERMARMFSAEEQLQLRQQLTRLAGSAD